MWKVVRNLLLAGAVLAGGGMLALWAAAQQQAAELAQRLAPWGALAWSGAGADLAGTFTLSQMRFIPKAGLGIGAFEARELRVRTPGAAWLAWRAMSRDKSVPEVLGIDLVGARLPAVQGFESAPSWFGRVSMVPFEALGCGAVPTLSAAQYQTMGVAPQLPDIETSYRYEAAEHALALNLATTNPGFASLKAQLQLKSFSPAAFEQKAARDAVRIAQATFDYRDAGYLARRNAFCARQAGVAPEAFVELHLAAVQEFLKARRIVPAEGVIALYRKLVTGGGTVQLLSLPNANVAPTQYGTYDPEEVLRSLNLTARHDDSPPELFKLFFLAAGPVDALAGIDATLVHDPLAEPEAKPASPPATPAATGDVATTVVAPAAPAPQTTPAVANTAATTPPQTPLAKAAPPPSPAVPAKPVTEAPPIVVASEPPKTAPAKRPSGAPVFAPKPVRPTTAPPQTAVVSAPTPGPATVPTLRVSPPPEDPRVAGRASAPAPAPGSTAALVWQGAGVDRLDTENKPEAERRFVVVAYDNLGGHVGARVALITTGGKEIEGRVASVDGTGVLLSVQRDTGQAQFFVERARILEIRLQRPVRG